MPNSSSMSKICAIAGLMVLLNLPSLAGAQQLWSTKGGIRRMNDSIEQIMSDVGIPALSLAVIKNNRIVYFKTYGYKHSGKKDPVNEETIFQAGSLTKSALVFIVYKLVDEGLFDLDRPMYKYLEYAPLEHDPRYKLITPRMIMSHCSGIENVKADNNPDTLDIVSDPGKKFVYSGEGYVYLSKVVELILHERYEDYVNEMVIEPLGLTRTYTHFSRDGKYPENYAYGYSIFGKEFEKHKDTVPDPMGSMNMTAQDYARLLLAIFNGKYLSQNRMRDLLHPMIRLDPANPDYFYGPGFQVLFSSRDTIISHGGSTWGFKAGIYYSKVSKDGFVYLSSGDRGDAIANKLNKLTVGLDLRGIFRSDLFPQYPSDAGNLLRTYNKKGTDALFEAVEQLEKTGDTHRISKALDEMGYLFIDHDTGIARRLLVQDVALFPQSSIPAYLLGETYLAMGNYKLAYRELLRARALHFDLAPMDYDL